MNKKVLVLNMGMKSIRSIVFDQNGNRLASSARPLSTGLNENRVFQDPNEWWRSAEKVIRQTTRDLSCETIDYITVTASASCLVYTDESYHALDSCIMVSDKRDSKECARISELEKKGLFDKKNGASGAMLSKILWVKENQHDKFRNSRWFLSPNDFLIAKLTGQSVTDEFNALKLYCDIDTHRYPEQGLKELGIDIERLPEVVDVGTNIGNILPDVADLLGLDRTVQVVISTYDAICSFFGSGAANEGEASDVSGTVTVMRALTYKENLHVSGKIFITPFSKEKCNIVGGSNNLGGGLVEWGKQCYYHNEPYPYEVMEKEAAESTLGANGLLFLPYLLGERAPIWDQTVRGMFFGIERYHTRKDMMRAILESTAFIDMDFVNAIEDSGVSITGIRMSGGLARINLVSQIKADAVGKEIKVLSDFETTAAGAAMIVLESAGIFSDMRQAAKSFTNIRMLIKPNWKNHLKYQKIFGLYKRLYDETKNLYLERKRLLEEIYFDRECIIDNL